MDALLQVVSKVNREIFDKVKKEDADMYSAFIELMKPEIDEAVSEKTVEAIENAIRKLHMSKEEACAFMDTTVEEYETYKLRIKKV